MSKNHTIHKLSFRMNKKITNINHIVNLISNFLKLFDLPLLSFHITYELSRINYVKKVTGTIHRIRCRSHLLQITLKNRTNSIKY